jgi:O-antigen/teichoic acid export membrane protein
MVPMIPVLTAFAVKDRELFVRQVQQACGLAGGLGACGAVAGVVLARDLVNLLYRGRYLEGPLSCVNAFQWLAGALGLVCVTTVLTASLLADRNEKLLLTIGTTALLVNAALNLVLLRRYNFTAAGFATAVTELLFLAGALAAFQMVTRHSALTWSVALNLLPAVLMGAVLHFMGGGPALRVVCGIGLGLLSAAAILSSKGAQRFRREMAAASPVF